LIYLFSDFGWAGPYVGEMKAVLARDLPSVGLIDLMHDAPAFNPKASAYLLAALSEQFKPGDICLGVIDPGVGDKDRRALIVDADGVQFVGPDNGLFAVLAHRAKQVDCRNVLWQPERLSASFHGRDLFAPTVSRLHRQQEIESDTIFVRSMVGDDYPDQLAEIIYLDHYGNAVTGLSAARYSDLTIVTVRGRQIPYARTFSAATTGELFWYKNSMGLIEVAANQASAQALLGLSVGTAVVCEN
jgi:S-adenosylmethionine hydrolase